MEKNYSKLKSRVFDSIQKTDLIKIRDILQSIQTPTLTSGVGGSHIVSNFLSKVLNSKNNIICENITPRDLLYRNTANYDNIIACSYGGTNYGVQIALNTDFNKFLLSSQTIEGINNITYSNEDKEKSFISLAATLIPMTILLLYYTDNDIELVKEILQENFNCHLNSNIIYEILSGYETTSAALFLESTMTESGIGIPIIHDKYDYCHGRSTLNHSLNQNNNQASKENSRKGTSKNNLIYFSGNTELDKTFKDELHKYYKNIIEIEKKYSDDIINDYYLTYISMLLCYSIARYHGKDLSTVNYSPIVRKLYTFKGEM